MRQIILCITILGCNTIAAQNIMFASRDNPANNFQPLMVSVDMTTCGDAVRLPFPLEFTSPNGVRFAITPDSLCYFFDGAQEFYSIYKYTGNDFLPLVELFNYVLPVGRNQSATYGEDDWIYLGGTDLTRFHTRERRFEEYSVIKTGSISISGITRHKGELYYVERLDFGVNQLNKLDDDLSTITTIIDTIDNVVVNDQFQIKSLQCHCEDVKLISNNPLQTIYEFDLENKTRSPLCEIESIYPLDPNNARMHGQQSFIGFPEWSECALSIDLDLDDEVVQKTRDYHLRDICGYSDLHLSDDDVQVFASGGVIDSIVVEIMTPTSDQYLTGTPSSHVSIDGDGQSHVVLIGDGQETFDDYEEVIRSLRYIDDAPDITVTIKEVNFRAYRDTLSGQIATAFLHIMEAPLTAGEDMSIEVCEAEEVDLNTYLPSDIEGGVWDNQTGIIEMDGLQDTSIMYITSGIICPSDSAIYSIQVAPTGVEEMIILEYCSGDSIFYEGQYYNVPSAYIDTIVSTTTSCDSIYKIVEIIELNQAQIVESDTMLCNGDVLVIGGQDIITPGIYSDTISNSAGCDSLITQFKLAFAPQAQELFVDTVICSGSNIVVGERIIDVSTTDVFSVVGDSGCDSVTYNINLIVTEIEEISIDTLLCTGESIEIQNQLYDETTDETIVLTDINGCDSLMYILLIEVEDIEQELYQEYEVTADELTTIPIIYDGSYNSILWMPQVGLSCSDCLDPEVMITEDMVYNVEIENGNGCKDIIEVAISVHATSKTPVDAVYLPNVIDVRSSNNNRFYIQTAQNEMITYSLSVYDRWGNQVFLSESILSNDADSGWDGQHQNGIEISQGVYVYKIVTEEGEVISGDILVLR